MKSIYKILLLSLFILVTVSCSKDFLEQPVEDAIVSDNFYNTDDQLLSASAALYGRPWFYYNDKFRWAMGDSYSGNSVGSFEDLVQFVNFAMNPNNTYMIEGWESYWVVVTVSNSVLKAIDESLGDEVTEQAKNTAKGEALFMRAVAYFHLVRLWGPLPILDKITIDNNDPLQKNTVESIHRFIREDLEMAALLLPLEQATRGRVGKTAAWSYLAKLHLTLENYGDARTYSELVINSGLHALETEYHQQFVDPTYENINNESIFALQWFVNCSLWGTQNTNQAYFAASGTITKSGDGWGTCQPSVDLQRAYETSDKRRYWTLMEPGSSYEELDTANGGYVVPASGLTSTIAGFRKYIAGSPDEFANVCFMRTELPTHMMRYAEVLLIQAEAILNDGDFTTDPNALSAINTVRRRAGLPVKTVITLDDILQERRIELALESKYWFDLQRIDRTKAIGIISNQERGVNIGDNPNQVSSNKITPSESDFLFPIPSGDASFISKDEPVDFYAN
ncbi:RagB/SusD family nutrient uptake outer membrane protein [uncultured Polaribacter sp.]|uniref:RagB/SusD family nutrient uptake outer membrane protein n=1 Tax=uncultured Polaribacter sp. TaxID=174711 RepID=UPI0026380BA1|nr:RagB/SusD family nutrient uptake outer membrane protein [uncultured Polaribacter sp.]